MNRKVNQKKKALVKLMSTIRIKPFLILLFFLFIFSLFVNSVYARFVAPPPTTIYGVFINKDTQECGIEKVQDTYFTYEYPSNFKLNKTIFDYNVFGRLLKKCNNSNVKLDCELGKDGNDDYCKASYIKYAGSDAGYDECILTHPLCALSEFNPNRNRSMVIGYLDFVNLKPVEKTFKPSEKPKLIRFVIFIIFTLLLLPAFNIFILVKKIFPKILRIIILVFSIIYWIIVLLFWLLPRIFLIIPNQKL